MGSAGRYGKYGDFKRNMSLMRARKEILSKSRAHFKKVKGYKDSFHKGYFAPSNIRIIKADKSHLGFVTRLSKRLFSIYGEYGEPAKEWFLNPSTFTLIALFNRDLVGFAMLGISTLNHMDPPSREILAIGVKPGYQRQGFGRQLLRNMESHAIDMKIPRIYLHTAHDNIPAKTLFKKMGYKALQLREGFYPAGQDAILMYKSFSD